MMLFFCLEIEENIALNFNNITISAESNFKMQRIIFLFELFDRSFERHIIRILKHVYSKEHFYYLHVDSVKLLN